MTQPKTKFILVICLGRGGKSLREGSSGVRLKKKRNMFLCVSAHSGI
jgi:hypothetical protein